MDVTGMMGAMQDPQGTMAQYLLKGMIQEHPNEWQQCQQMFQGKNHKQQVSELRKLYASRGMDLDEAAKRWGIKI